MAQAVVTLGSVSPTSTNNIVVSYSVLLNSGERFGGSVSARAKDAKSLLSAIVADALAKSPVPLTAGDIIVLGGIQ